MLSFVTRDLVKNEKPIKKIRNELGRAKKAVNPGFLKTLKQDKNIKTPPHLKNKPIYDVVLVFSRRSMYL
jgi:hypothetical protein